MERPLEDARPLGPFAQSGEFSRSLLGSDSAETVEDSDTYFLELSAVSQDAVENAEAVVADVSDSRELEQFVVLNMVGDVQGTKQGDRDTDMMVNGLYFFASEVRDRDVEVHQLEQLFRKEVHGEGLSVVNVNLYKL